MTRQEQFLTFYEREHATTRRVLQAYPADRLDLRPHPKSKTARELAWVFAAERAFGRWVLNNGFADGAPGKAPDPPASKQGLLAGIEKAHQEFCDFVRTLSEEQLVETVRFFTAPKTMGDVRRIDFLWFLGCDEIHHRGQLSIYLRMADGKVPSIYGPTADEP